MILIIGWGLVASTASASNPTAIASVPRPTVSDGPIYEQPAERITVRTYTPDDGLPATELRDLEIDEDGFVWLATIGGLARFDGHTFTSFVANPKDPDAIPKFVIDNLATDPVSGIWAAAGVMVHANSLNNNIERTDVRAVRMTRADKLIWAWEPGTMKLFDPATRTVVMETKIGVVGGDGYAVHIAPISDDLAVVAGDDGIWTVTASGKTTFLPTRLAVRDAAIAWTSGTSSADEPEKVWIVDDERLSSYDVITNELDTVVERVIAHPGAEKAPMSSGGLLERHDGTVWIATELGGIEVYVPETGELKLIPHSETATGLAPKVANFSEDNQDGLWMSAFGVGIQYLPAGLPPVWSATIPTKPDGSEIIDTYLDLEVIGDTVWVASDGGGLQSYNAATGEFGEPVTTENSDLPSDSVIGLARNGDELWLGMWDGAITRYNTVTGEFRPLLPTTLGGPVAGTDVFDIAAGRDGTMWASVWGEGVQVFDADGVPQRLYGPNGDMAIHGTDVIETIPDYDGATWFAGWSGLERLDHRTGKVTRWSTFTGDLLGDVVFDVYFQDDANGLEIIWLATAAGLESIDPKTGETEHFGQLQGIPGPAVLQIIPIPSRNNIWLTTDHRLIEFDPREQRVVQTFSAADGLPSMGFARYGSGELPDGITVISTKGGLAFARGADVVEHDPPVYLTGFSVDDKSLSAEGGQVEFGVEAIRVNVTFTGLDYRQPDGVTYEYRLVGLEDEWVRTPDGAASYSRLAPGDYRFEVRARTAAGEPSSKPAVLSITVVPHWYQMTIAKFIAAAALMLLVGLGIAVILRGAHHRSRVLEQLVAERTSELEEQTAQARAANAAKSEFVSNVSHELRNPLQSVLGFAELISLSSAGQQQQRWAEQIHTSGSDLLSMIEELLELSSLESSATPLDVSPVNVRALVEEIAEGINHAPTTKKHVSAAVEVRRQLVWCDSRRLRQVIANLTLNAIRHSSGQNVIIGVRDIAQDDVSGPLRRPFSDSEPDSESPVALESIGRFRFFVRDEGPGMSVEEVEAAFEPFVRGKRAGGKGVGLGLAISRQLVSRLGGNLAVDTAPGSPTEFYFELDLRMASPHAPEAVSDLVDDRNPASGQTDSESDQLAEQLAAKFDEKYDAVALSTTRVADELTTDEFTTDELTTDELTTDAHTLPKPNRSTHTVEDHTQQYERLSAVVVDADPLARQAVADALTLLGVTVHLAESGEGAVGLVGDPDVVVDLLVVSDRLPDIDTSDVVRSARERSVAERLSIFVTSAQPESVVAFAGADETLRKPISLYDFAAALQNRSVVVV